MTFDRTMEEVQSLLQEYGYAVAHTQRCDGGLTDFGYKTDFYRVIFFGKIDEVRAISEKQPELVPFVPLKILVFAESGETVIVSLDPHTLSRHFENPELQTQLSRWRSDIISILDELRDKSIKLSAQTTDLIQP